MDQIREELQGGHLRKQKELLAFGSQLKRVAKIMANNRPGTFIWCMGGTQHTTGNNNTRAYCVFSWLLETWE